MKIQPTYQIRPRCGCGECAITVREVDGRREEVVTSGDDTITKFRDVEFDVERSGCRVIAAPAYRAGAEVPIDSEPETFGDNA